MMDKVFLGLSLLSLPVVAFLFHSKHRTAQLPPGPPRNWILGNLLDLLKIDDLLASVDSWQDTYGQVLEFIAIRDSTKFIRPTGDIVSLECFGVTVIFLNTLECCVDLLERRAANYSHRPKMPFVRELVGLDKSFGNGDIIHILPSFILSPHLGFMDFSEESVRGRRIANLAFKASAVRRYSPALQDNVVVLMQDLFKFPEGFESVLERRNIQLALSLIFGITLDGTNQHYITTTMDCVNRIAGNVLPGSRIVDFLPFLKYLPSWVPFKRDAKQLNALVNDAFGSPFEDAKRRMASGSTASSFVSLILSSEEVQGDIDTEKFQEMMKWISGTMFMAAAESTTSTVRVFFKAMARFPAVQARAQEELDRVLGNRLPEMNDRASLPYLNALLQEVIRWESIVPSGFPRRSNADDVYKGMLIPKGAVILANSRSISRHEHGKGSPDEFDPTRFLEGGGARPVLDYVFGFGKRECPGRFLAEASVWITIASVLKCFNIAKLEDSGKTITARRSGVIHGTTSLECKVIPRHDAYREMIQAKTAEMEAAQFA
ncbi:cytochrome P450 [Lentinula aff. detonsa]|uniref:Cytochrome P450 n=1 Tax=Lentinula aff. detonsa TaxID=2804958 RepID=A0AA38NI12_9AGAR|nr:cytochrome P450 [Lentinula aff. detonsa]